MLRVLLQVHLRQDLQEEVVLVVQEQLQEFQDHASKEAVVEVVEHNIQELMHPAVLVVVEQVVRVKVGLHVLRQVQLILVVVEVVTKMDQHLEEQVVVE
tara:strand:+ start:1363 stop:1659 length:297 start_codon:yes stop_codon:yes gene_type:complete